jgi:hypothetical protein
MKVALASVLAVTLALAAHRTAHADSASAVLAAQGWWDELNNSDTLPTPTKKSPLLYGVFPYAADACGVFESKRVDKVTNRKTYLALSDCLHAGTEAGSDPQMTWEASDVDMLVIGFDYDRKLEKKIRKAVKKLRIVSLEITGGEAPVHVFFALDKKDVVKGVYLYVDSAN